MPLTKAQLNEWCDTLEKYPERQCKGQLVDSTGTKFCCLGQLAVLNGAEIVPTHAYEDGENDLKFTGSDFDIYEHSFLKGDILNTFGSDEGIFYELGMPVLSYEGESYDTAVLANDGGVPWGVIANHFRKYYKTAD